jgi:uncharacterized membrane protein YoaK (UPF0700 family)
MRTTHLTGSMTDIGITLGRYARGDNSKNWRLSILVTLIISFWFGALIAGLLYPTLGKYQILVNAVFFGCIGFAYVLYLRLSRFRIPMWMTGFGDGVVLSSYLKEYSALDKSDMHIDPDYISYTEGGEAVREAATAPSPVTMAISSAPPLSAVHHNPFAHSHATPTTTASCTTLGQQGIHHPAENPSYATPSSLPSVAHPPPRIVLIDNEYVTHPDRPSSSHHPHDHSYSSRREKKKKEPRSIEEPFIYNRDPLELRVIAIGCVALAINAGAVSAISMCSPAETSVAGVTGPFTRSALDVAQGDYNSLCVIILLIVCYTLGAFFTSLIIPTNVFNLSYPYPQVLLLEAFFLFLCAIINILWAETKLGLGFAAAAMGVQNGIVNKFGGGIIRTANTTGAYTDIGATLGRLVMGRRSDVWQLRVLIPLVLCFILGSVIGTLVYGLLKEYSLLGNVVYVCVLAYVYDVYYTQEEEEASVGCCGPLKRLLNDRIRKCMKYRVTQSKSHTVASTSSLRDSFL